MLAPTALQQEDLRYLPHLSVLLMLQMISLYYNCQKSFINWNLNIWSWWRRKKKETLGTNLQEYDILYSDLSCVTMWWQGVEYFTPLPVNYSNTCRQTDRTARRGLKQLPRRNQIKMRLDLISVFLCHFFFVLLRSWPIFLCCYRRDRKRGGVDVKGGITSVLSCDRQKGRKRATDRQRRAAGKQQTTPASELLCVLRDAEETHIHLSTQVWKCAFGM